MPLLGILLLRIPVTLNWIIAAMLLGTGLAFYPFWWKIKAKLYGSSAWAKARGWPAESVQGHAGLLMAGGLWLLIVGTAWWHGYPTDQGGQPATFLTQTEFMEKLHAGLITHCIVSYNQKTFPITEIRGTFVEPEINSTTKDNPATRAEISFITPTVFLAPKMREELLASKNCEVETPANTLLGEIIDGIRHQLSNGRSGAR